MTSSVAWILANMIQLRGDPSDKSNCTLPFLDIKTKVPSQYSLLILNATLNLMSTKHSVKPDGPPCRYIEMPKGLSAKKYMFACDVCMCVCDV